MKLNFLTKYNRREVFSLCSFVVHLSWIVNNDCSMRVINSINQNGLLKGMCIQCDQRRCDLTLYLYFINF